MNVITQSPNALEVTFESNKTAYLKSDDHFVLLQGILEGMPDGILIVSKDGKLTQSNSLGRQLCEQLIDRPTPIDAVPKPIWRLCEALLDSLETFGSDEEEHQTFVIEEDIPTNRTTTIRVRVQWLNQDAHDFRMLVVLEDRCQTARQRAIAEGKRYGLTNREAEVWLYRCIGYTYKQISNELFITIDTVKKHVKSINVKRDTCQALNGEQM